MSSHFSISIPTKPYLKKYLHANYGDPAVFGFDDEFGPFIALALDKNVFSDRNYQVIHKAFDKYTEQLTCFLPKSWIKHYRYGTGIAPKKVVALNKLLEKFFEKELAMYCKVHTKHKVERKTAIEDFCKDNGIDIEYDITFENLKKTEFRYRQKIFNNSQRNLSRQNSELFKTTISH